MVLLFYVETTIYNLITVGLDIAWRMKVLFLAWLYLALELKLPRIQRPQKNKPERVALRIKDVDHHRSK